MQGTCGIWAASGDVYEESLLFSIRIPADNLFGLPAGFLLDPSVDAGHYVHLDPLEPGRHLIHFRGELPSVLTVESPTG